MESETLYSQPARSAFTGEDHRESGLSRDVMTVAYLSGSPGGKYNFEKWLMWRGVAEAAKEYGMNLLYLAGEEFEKSPQAVLYELVGRHNVDGLIIWNSFVSP